MIACTIGTPKAIYISTPITNGQRARPWRASLPAEVLNNPGVFQARLQAEVIEPNCAEGRALAARVRAQTGMPVIDPTPFMAKGWTQSDYLELWTCVIETYAQEVWFNDGWEHSNGCVQEYLAALKAGIPTKDATGQPLPADRACALIEKVIPLLDTADSSSSAYRSVASAIIAFSPKEPG